MRVFIAIPLPLDIKANLARLQRVFRALSLDATWVRASHLHVTLKFLGEVEPTRIDSIAVTMTRVARDCEPFSLSLTGMGVFPQEISPRVLWVGIEDSKLSLNQLYHEIESSLLQSGFPPEERPFKPHLTIARLKRVPRPQEFLECLHIYHRSEIGRFGVDRIELLESRLRPSRAEYVVLNVAPLGGDQDIST